MTEPDDVAIGALRRFDQPHDLDAAASRRIEAQILGRFDDAASRETLAAGSEQEIVELRRVASTPSRVRSALILGLTAAAVVALLGAVVLVRAGSRDIDVPATQPTVAPIVEDVLIVEQLQSYCVEFIQPLVAASALWTPVRFAAEYATDQRSDVLVAIERAAQALVDLAPPAGDLFGGRAGEILDLSTAARRAATLGPEGDAAVAEARDAIVAEIESTPAASSLPECATG